MRLRLLGLGLVDGLMSVLLSYGGDDDAVTGGGDVEIVEPMKRGGGGRGVLRAGIMVRSYVRSVGRSVGDASTFTALRFCLSGCRFHQ